MDDEERMEAILSRMREMGIAPETPIYTLTWEDVARVMAESEVVVDAGTLTRETLHDILDAVQYGFEYLDWYENIENSLRSVNLPVLKD